MSRSSDGEILFIHSAARPYRHHLFRLLEQDLGCKFVFVGLTELNRAQLPAAGIEPHLLLRDRSLGPYKQGVSGSIIKLALRGQYKAWISFGLTWFPTHVSFPIVRSRRRPFVLWTEDWWWPKEAGAGIISAYGRAILRGASSVVASGTQAKHFAIAGGAAKDKVFAGGNAGSEFGGRLVSEAEILESRDRLAGPNAGFVFLFVNRLVEYKGLDLLIRAFGKIVARHPTSRLVVVGDGPNRRQYERLATEVCSPETVHFVGSLPYDNLHFAYLAADLYVHPARLLTEGRVRAEAWGFSINEAMSLGTPVLATTAVGAVADLIIDSETGFVVPHDDEAALEAGMKYTLENPDQLTKVGSAAKTRMQSWTVEQQAAAFADALDFALGGRA